MSNCQNGVPIIELDASSMPCPLPIVHAKKQLKSMQLGQTLHLITADPSSIVDVAAFVATNHYNLLDSYQERGSYHFLIKKSFL